MLAFPFKGFFPLNQTSAVGSACAISRGKRSAAEIARPKGGPNAPRASDNPATAGSEADGDEDAAQEHGALAAAAKA
jgi:hypothetical protein